MNYTNTVEIQAPDNFHKITIAYNKSNPSGWFVYSISGDPQDDLFLDLEWLTEGLVMSHIENKESIK
jgi:hypothetical protein